MNILYILRELHNKDNNYSIANGIIGFNTIAKCSQDRPAWCIRLTQYITILWPICCVSTPTPSPYLPTPRDGEAWHRQRSALNRHLLQSASVAGYTTSLDEAVKDLLAIVEDRAGRGDGGGGAVVEDRAGRGAGGGGAVVEDLHGLLFRWSLECTCTAYFTFRVLVPCTVHIIL